MKTRSRSVLVLLFDEVEALDVVGPVQALSVAGRRYNFRPFAVTLAGPRVGPIDTRNQLRLEATVDFASAEPPEILLVPGGYGARRALDDPATVAAVARLGEDAEVLLAVGWGVALLGRAGLLGNAEVAASGEIAESLKQHAPEARAVSEPDVVAGERVVTVKGSADALALGLFLVERLLGKKFLGMTRRELGVEPGTAGERIEIVPVRR